MKPNKIFRLSLIFFLLIALPAAQSAQQEPIGEELAKQTQNPVADLISVPLQNNWNFKAGFNHNKTIYALNVQPVIPIKLNEEWNLITRVIMPIINQPNLAPSSGGSVPSTTGTGFGDFNPTFSFARQARRVYLGSGSHIHSADRNRPRPRQRQMEHGAGGSRFDDAKDTGSSVCCSTISGQLPDGATRRSTPCCCSGSLTTISPMAGI